MPPKGMLTSGYDDKLYDVYLTTDYKKSHQIGHSHTYPHQQLMTKPRESIIYTSQR